MKILAGPDNWSFFTQYMGKGLAAYETRIFREGQDFRYPYSSFQDLLKSLPAGWEPDLVIWWLPEFQPVLPGIGDCPYPTLALISDWHILTDPLKELVGHFDFVATDRCGQQWLSQLSKGPQVLEGYLYGFDPDTHKNFGRPRQTQVGHAGDLHPHLHRRRLRHCAQVAEQLSSDFRLSFRENVFAQEYIDFLNDCQITLNYNLRGEMNMRCFEAPACGSLLFCEAGNESVAAVLEPNRHCVTFHPDELCDKVRYFLNHPDQLERLAQNGYQRIQEFSYAQQAARLLKVLQGQLKVGPRSRPPLLNYWSSVYNVGRVPTLAYAQTHLALQASSSDPQVLNWRGCVQAQAAETIDDLKSRQDFWQDALASLSAALPLGMPVYYSLARVLLSLLRIEEACQMLEKGLAARFCECLFYPRNLEPLNLLWQAHPEQREASLRWAMLDLLAQLRPEQAERFTRQALEQRQDQALTWFRLASVLPEGHPERQPALEKCQNLAPTFEPAWRLAGKAYPVGLQAHFPGGASSSASRGFQHGVAFRWLDPEQLVPRHLEARQGHQIEFSNTLFEVDDDLWKARLSRLNHVPRMSTIAVAYHLNRLVRQMPAEQAFVNVGVWHGFTFLASLLDNEDRCCVGVDNFSQFGGPKREFEERFAQFRSPLHQFHEMDYRDYFALHQQPLGVYLYDGEHSYANQLEGLRVAEPFFAPGCYVLVDDTNWDEPRQATFDFVAQSQRRYELIFDLRSASNHHPTWWNGLMLWRCKE